MRIEEIEPGVYKVDELDHGRSFAAKLTNNHGPELKCLKTGAEVVMDCFRNRLQALVSDASTDEPAVLVKFDDIGEIISIRVRADLRSKVETL